MEYSNESLYNELVAHKHIIPMGVQGVFARGADFENVLNRFDTIISKLAEIDGADKMTFPPCMPREQMEKSGYLDSFPQFAGTVFSFKGNEAKHQELKSRIHAGDAWGDLQTMTDCCLTPAACYPVYPTCSGVVPENGRLIELQNWVFRHEPSPEPTRMQFFRMHEVIRIGTTQMVVEYRDRWLQRGLELLCSLGLPAKADVANDPFFGRGGRIMAANQKEMKLKFEILVPVISAENPTAVCSFNYHQDKFGSLFNINASFGIAAHIAHMLCG